MDMRTRLRKQDMRTIKEVQDTVCLRDGRNPKAMCKCGKAFDSACRLGTPRNRNMRVDRLKKEIERTHA